jgi:hypothetical protein
MRELRCRLMMGLAFAIMACGCHGTQSRRVAGSAEPALALPGDSGAQVVEAPPPPQVTFADRHPLLYKPRQYYENSSSSNKVVKVAAATVIGVPAGIVGELRQIVVGQPASPSY